MGKKMYPLAVCMVVFYLANISCRGRCSIEHDVGLRHSSRNDVIFVDQLLWVLPTKSTTGCAVACMKDYRCVSFTVTVAAGGSGTRIECRGHSAEPQGTGVAHPGARLYFLLARSSTSGKSLSSAATRASSSPSSTRTASSSTASSLSPSTSSLTSAGLAHKEESSSSSAPEAAATVLSGTHRTSIAVLEVFNAVTSTKSPSATLHQRRTSPIYNAVISTIKSPSATVQRRITSHVSISAAKGTVTSPPASSSAGRGHRTLISSTALAPLARNVYTHLPGLPEQCTTNSDCSPAAAARHVECFENMCLCSPGFYYSLASGDCLYDCSEDDLQRVMIAYPMWYLASNNYVSTTVDFNQCLDLCLNDSSCRSMEYRYSLGLCSLSTYTPLDIPQAWTRSTPLDRLYYFQRACT